MRRAAAIALALALASGCSRPVGLSGDAAAQARKSGGVTVEIAPLDDAALLAEDVARFVEAHFHAAATVAAPADAPEGVRRRVSAGGEVQLCAEDIVSGARESLQAGHIRLILTARDLYSNTAEGRQPGYVFGMAELGGGAAVVSVARLGLSYPGQPAGASPGLRLRKLAVHELGHVLGLDHCGRFDCAMRPAGSLEELDRRPVEPCAACWAALDLFMADGSARRAGLAQPKERR